MLESYKAMVGMSGGEYGLSLLFPKLTHPTAAPCSWLRWPNSPSSLPLVRPFVSNTG